MKRSMILLFIFLFSPAVLAQEVVTPQEITIKAKDGINIYGDIYQTGAGQNAPVILLFHQAGSNARAEYGPLVRKLLDTGYNILAIDQRNGGSRLGGVNRTVEKLGENVSYSYCEAYVDLEAALAYVKDNGYSGKVFAWGSSYSAALVVRLGTEHADELAGVLAFSPASGNPMGECQPNKYFENYKLPLLALRPAREMEVPSVQDQMELLKRHNLQTYVAANGVHGSSMLNEARVKASTEDTWKVVLKFLADHSKD